MEVKQCSKCKESKDSSQFIPNKAYCKRCDYIHYKRPYLLKRLEKQGKKPREVLTDEERELRKKQRLARYRRSEKGKLAHKKNKTRVVEKMRNSLRRRLYKALGNEKGSGEAIRQLGCSVADFKAYIEGLFTEGMTWDNYGEWHLDHIKPLCSFDLTKEEHILEACNYRNLRPLWAKDNLAKVRDDIKQKYVR